jgi:alpha-beta hydrolase superfamily lysophospholipase
MEKELWFQADGLRLHGTLHLPAAPSPPVVIGCHGLAGTGDSPKQLAVAKACGDSGIAFFRFDHRGCGRSEGAFAAVTTLAGRCRDLLAAAEALRRTGELGSGLGLFGSSLGGTVVLACAERLHPGAVVTAAAPVRSRGIRAPGHGPDAVERQLTAADPGSLSFDISDRIGGITDILVFHGDADQVVPFSSALEIHEKAGPPKEMIRLEGGDHLMSSPSHQRLFMERTAEWYCTRLLSRPA